MVRADLNNQVEISADLIHRNPQKARRIIWNWFVESGFMEPYDADGIRKLRNKSTEELIDLAIEQVTGDPIRQVRPDEMADWQRNRIERYVTDEDLDLQLGRAAEIKALAEYRWFENGTPKAFSDHQDACQRYAAVQDAIHYKEQVK